VVIVLMGVAGSGKTTVGRELARQLGWRLIDADDLHSERNRSKMRRGEPLTDQDRQPWLAAVHAEIGRAVSRREHLIVACSALKERYRQTLRGGMPTIRFVYLEAERALLRRRLETRGGHYAGPDLLASQLEDLEPPSDAIVVSADQTPAAIAEIVRREIGV
jgi:carbohydrate kinase (thermoresistant glucokinase family)